MTDPSLQRARTPAPHGARPWSVPDADELYGIPAWGHGVFCTNAEGHLQVLPEGDPQRGIDLFELVESLRERDLQPPLLIRLFDVLAARLRAIRSAFDRAIEARGFGGRYRCLYPIKVNQERHLCEEIRDLGLELDFGLEAGSKPELLAVLGLTADLPQMPIMCNGFKDDEFIETVTLATKLGRNILPIIESPHELDQVLEQARVHAVRPRIGMRLKLYSRAATHWKESSGWASKFGLSASEILAAVERLDEAGMKDCLHLVHCHIGSQINRLSSLRTPLQEIARAYVELVKAGTGVRAIDVGGGLGVDYQGGRNGRGSSIDYDVVEYAKLVVGTIAEVCDQARVPHPDIFTESGRAMVATSSVLVVDVLERRRNTGNPTYDDIEATAAMSSLHSPLSELWHIADSEPAQVTDEVYARALKARDQVQRLFRNGKVGLRPRALAEDLFDGISALKAAHLRDADDPPRKRAAAEPAELYIANFSIFQSLPDSWALDQVFPVCPIHRLGERPDRVALLGDITCDSDGKIDRFAGTRGKERRTLPVHELRAGEPYYLGIFLVGAYQEILGDLHNLFGDTNAVHVRLDEDGQWMLEELVAGETVREVLGYLHYDADRMLERLRREVESAIRTGSLSITEGKGLLSNFAIGLNGYTYLE